MRLVSPQQILITVMMGIVANKSTDMLNHIQFVFYHNINLKENGFFRARAEKGIAWHIDASSVVWTLINNSKLANQIARLVAIVEKKEFVNNIKNTPSYRK